MQGKGIPTASSCGLDEQCWGREGWAVKRVRWANDRGAEGLIQVMKINKLIFINYPDLGQSCYVLSL